MDSQTAATSSSKKRPLEFLSEIRNSTSSNKRKCLDFPSEIHSTVYQPDGQNTSSSPNKGRCLEFPSEIYNSIDQSQTTPKTASPRTGSFFDFPYEIRNKIYRILMHDTEVIPCFQDATYRRPLSAQLLRTCRKFHCEALPILYGENTWRIEILHHDLTTNKIGALFPPQPVVHVLHNGQVVTRQLPLRQIEIRIRDYSGFEISTVRSAVRFACEWLSKLPEIDTLQLTGPTTWCTKLRCGRYDHSPCKGYTGSEKQLLGIYETWLDRIRGVNHVRIDRRIPRESRDAIKRAWKGWTEVDPLPGMYEVLEKYADELQAQYRVRNGGLQKFISVKDSLRQAVRAVEIGDVKTFGRARKVVVKQLVKCYGKEVVDRERVFVCDPKLDEKPVAI